MYTVNVQHHDPAEQQWVKIPGLHPSDENALRLMNDEQLDKLIDRARDAKFKLEQARKHRAHVLAMAERNGKLSKLRKPGTQFKLSTEGFVVLDPAHVSDRIRILATQRNDGDPYTFVVSLQTGVSQWLRLDDWHLTRITF